uniref:Midasin n=1 Tax=Trypanosoma congolense (strain IL3000) TaxID=1068625 RepID=G0UIS9_TRYCI|nr:unnamed protein product [Trypanosoma congolense IL3000]
MIPTPASEYNLRNLKVSFSTSQAVLVQGEVGCGKSFLVKTLAESFGVYDTMVQVNVDDSFDSRDLLGKFSATDVPGAFEWVSGPLTTAVKSGLWILMEDIDLASFDVFSVLLSLLEESTLFLPDKNERIRAHPNFKIIATQQLRVVGDTLTTRKGVSIPFVELWGVTVLKSLTPGEMCDVATSMYTVPRSIVSALSLLPPLLFGNTLLTIRSLLKWCKRVSRRLPGGNASGNFISSTIREMMFREAFDCMLSGFSMCNEVIALTSILAESMGILPNVADSLINHSKPEMAMGKDYFLVGRVTIPLYTPLATFSQSSTVFAATRHSMTLLERIAAAVDAKENVLLTGETGVGKTFVVQYLADKVGQKLIVHNLDNQTDTSDFMGGWKPLDVSVAVRNSYQEFVDLFSQSFNSSRNAEFLNAMQIAIKKCSWLVVLKHIMKGCGSFKLKSSQQPFSEQLKERWISLGTTAQELLTALERTRNTFAFRFEEGSLVRAWREGYWILLDEVNLASTEILERISSVLGDIDTLYLTDKAAQDPIPRHKNFHVFANMNPPTDVGKKDIPPSLRSKFTEIYVDEPFEEGDVIILVNEFIGHLAADCKTQEITAFFLDYVGKAKSTLCSLDCGAKPPSVSLRTLTRAMTYVRRATSQYGFALALFDGLMLGFATSLERQFHPVVENLIKKHVFRSGEPPRPTLPTCPSEGRYVAYEHIWLPVGSEEPCKDDTFILTPSVRGHLLNVARAVFADRSVLLEGPTSSGKSSMVRYLAELTGHKFIRINNHESTEIQEYIGHYVSDEYGKLRFVDGILVDAVRNGYWVMLDELNLAPTDVLEALNRLLDDNHELFVPDTQETIKSHPQLRVFATQNPAGIYGGRKPLSRAFRNRFLEITVDDIPNSELCTILCERYSLSPSFAEKMVEIMTTLQLRRQGSQVFAGRHGFITPRDLFRWAERHPRTYQEMAEHGFLLLADRCRKLDERQIVKDVIESITRTELDERTIYSPHHWPFIAEHYKDAENRAVNEFGIVWTESMLRLFTVVGICLLHKEPVLLVGETGSSKTTVCQLWASILKRHLSIVNCHQHSEAADFLGSLRPALPNQQSNAIFQWRNGPLVECMLQGGVFVLDEISLAEDSVLERLNSVLEPGRTVTLAEKSTADVICAHEDFCILATMNPGGDFGKRELSPALRNRFTEIYVRPVVDREEVKLILSRRLLSSLVHWAEPMAVFLSDAAGACTISGSPQHISIRDIIGWVTFMNAAAGHCDEKISFIHGLDAVVLDGLGVGTGQSDSGTRGLRESLLSKAEELCGVSGECLRIPFWDLFDIMEEPKLPPEMEGRFFFGASSTCLNLSKLLRAGIMQRAILLEGSPGVGKTSIVEALGCAQGRHVVRINLSEQTDIMDLFGTFLPSPSSEESTGPQFSWSDGVLLQALKNGWWVILDELNLASQSVLEGLNALLDHRSTVFVPELGEEFQATEGFRLFACQNPLVEGGGRKGLPRSFLNRFTRVRVDPFDVDDLMRIIVAVSPAINESILRRMVSFVNELHHEVVVRRTFGVRGSPWEFNLRDILRWARLMEAYDATDRPCEFVNVLFTQRMRTDIDREMINKLAEKVFGGDAAVALSASESHFLVEDNVVLFGGKFLAHRVCQLTSLAEGVPLPLLLPSHTDTVRSLLTCAEQNHFCMLVGPSGAGKTYCIRTAATLVGVQLLTFSMNASCDTVDLLGGFNQVEGKQGQFEWSDSLILEAMQSGHWLVLDNVNYCSASVLDRLNPLVEPNGMLSVNEQGLVDGQIRVVRPHPNFRLFATLDPKYGEVSRAMRNRAVEIYVSPVKIPSLESVALTSANSLCRSTEQIDLLARYHREFLRSVFGADTASPMSVQLSDALAAGTPNTFTLVKTGAMLRAESNQEDLKACIRHKYIDNRCGHWSIHKDGVLERMDEFLNGDRRAPHEPLPTLTNLMRALSLEAVDEEDALPSRGLEAALVRIRVLRSGLALKTQMENTAGVVPCHSTFDLLLYFVLDQGTDSISSDALVESRRQFLHQTMRDVLSEEEMNDIISLVYPPSVALKVSYLDSLWCSSAQVLALHANSLRALCDGNVFISDSPALNRSFNHVLHVVAEALKEPTSAYLQQQLHRFIGPLVSLVVSSVPRYQINSDNYVSLLTKMTLVRSVFRKKAPASTGVPAAVDDFFTLLCGYLGFPFELVSDGQDVRKCISRPHVTTPEERASLAVWKASTNTVPVEKHEQLLKLLWTSTLFRSEFSLILHAQRLKESYVAALAKGLQSEIREFIDLYCTKLRVISQIHVTLWQEVLLVLGSGSSCADALESLLPLLVTGFISRYGLGGGYHSFCGSWVNAAVDVISYVESVSLAACGAKESSHVSTLDGLLKFCRVLPTSKANPFEEWEVNCLKEALILLSMCCTSQHLPHMGETATLGEGHITTPSKVLKRLRSLVAEVEGNSVLEAARPLLSMLVSGDGYAPIDSLRRVALVGALRFRLLVPKTPIDPMYKWLVKKEVAQCELSYFTRLDEAFRWSEELSMRDTCSKQRLLVREFRVKEEALLARAVEKGIVRPDPTGVKFAQLVNSLHQMRNTMLSDGRLAVVTSEEGTNESGSARRAWSEVLYQQITDILDNFGGYEDVTLTVAEPALSAALAAHIGYLMQTPSPKRGMILNVSDAIRMAQFPFLDVTSPALPPIGAQALQRRLQYLDSCLLLLQCTPARVFKRDFVEGLFGSYRDLYRAVEELEARERSEQELSVLYKEKAIVIEGDDEKHLRVLKQLFPSYEEDFIRVRDAEEEGATESATDGDALADTSQTPPPVSSTSIGRQVRVMLSGAQGTRYIRRLIDTHYHFFESLHLLRDQKTFNGDISLQAFKGRFDIISNELHGTGCRGVYECGALLSAEHEQQVLGGFAARAALLSKEFFSSTASPGDIGELRFDIFRDPAPSELRGFTPHLLNLMKALSDLSATYPDTPSLRRCTRIASCLAALPILTTPLMKVMTGCEILLRECYEWERNASRDTSIINHMTQLSAFVLRWRRLELHCWSHVFAAKREEWEMKAAIAWFKLCDLVGIQQVIPDDELRDRYLTFFQYCMDFMWGSSCGDFHVRLRLLRAFALHLTAAFDESSTFPMANAVSHLTDFFGQYSQLVSEKLKLSLSPIEEDMEEFTRIMRWEDSTYYAVRATAEKSHLKMGRGLAMLEDALRTPVLHIITAEEQRFEEDQAMGFVLSSVKLDGKGAARTVKKSARGSSTSGSKRTRAGESKDEKGIKPAKSRKRKPASDIKDDTVTEDEQVATNRGGGDLSVGVDFLREAANEIIERVTALQAPGVPQNQKVRALKTLFTVMEENGVPHTHVTQVPVWEELFATNKALLTCRSAHILAAGEQLEAATQEHYRGARWLQRMRDAENHPHKDLSGAQVKRGTGMAESLFAVSVQQVELVNVLCEVYQYLMVMRECVGACEERVIHAADEKLRMCIDICVQLQSFVHDVQWLLKERVFELEGPCSAVEELQRVVGELWRLCLTADGYRRAGVPVADTVMVQFRTVYTLARAECGRLCGTGIGCVGVAASKLCTSIDSLQEAIDSLLRAEEQSEELVCAKKPRVEVKVAWRDKVDAVVRSLECAFPNPWVRTDETDTASEPQQESEKISTRREAKPPVYQKYTTTVGTLLNEAKSVFSALHEVLHDDADNRNLSPKDRCDVLSRLDASVEHVSLYVSDAVKALHAQSHLTLVISRLLCILFRKGFCKPEENDEGEGDGDDDGDGTQLDGTGMDDGEGEKDVTDQIENEDQLMNAKDKEENEQEDKQKDEHEGSGDEEDNAADVETDFKANKEKRDENDNDEDEEEDDESDKEMGSVDGEDAQERKRMKKEKNEGNDMDSDDGSGAEDVPEDTFANEEDEMSNSGADEETANFENREAAIREAEKRQREGDEHDLAADGLEDEEEDSRSSDDDSKENDASSVGDEPDEKRNEVENGDERDSMERSSEARDAEDGDSNRNGSGEGGSDASSTDSADETEEEWADENVFHGGRQDERAGEEATEEKKDSKKRPRASQEDIGATEEQQPGEEQEQDDAGQSWRPQEKNEESKRRDHAERRASSRNPYKAIKEALQRHQRQTQQLNLNKRVEVQKQKEPDDLQRRHEDQRKWDEKVDEFEFDEEGEEEGMAATDERPPAPTEAVDDMPEKSPWEPGDPAGDGESSEADDDDSDGDDDTPLRRRQPANDVDVDMQSGDEENEEGSSANDKKSKRRVKVVKKSKNVEDARDSSQSDEDPADEFSESPDDKLLRGRKLWQEQTAAVHTLSHQLCEQLRLILAPTVADKLQGDYKTGKRLNMKRIIPYIASQFKKDRIWLRRTKPNKRNYQILVALDDSLSMHCNNAGVMSCRAVVLLAEALQQLEVGEFGIACFGKETRIVHEMHEPFIADSGPRALSEITFTQKSTNLRLLLQTTLDYLDSARRRMSGQTRSATQQLQQMMFIISDGQIMEDRAELRRLLLRAEENQQMIVFVLLDMKASGGGGDGSGSTAAAPLTADDLKGLTPAERMRRLKAEREARLQRVKSNSILDMQLVEFKGGNVVRRSYMESFPFPYYLVVRDLETLPNAIADALRQWFELLNVQY